MIKAADSIVISDVPFGWGNLKNLEAAIEARGHKPIILLEKHDGERDFTGGIAAGLIEKLKDAGAIIAKDAEQIMEKLEERK
jgi:iron complex transport system ATP-binding protein